ncbi:MAG: chemotaxis protein CheX [Thermodesulfobacteriota bacterium]
MATEQSRALMDAISDVLETMCFSCPVPLGLRDQSVEADELLIADAGFEGSRNGRLRLAISRALAYALTASFVGRRETELTPEAMQDAFMEVTNMVAGVFLQRIDPTSSLCVGDLRILDRGEADGVSP